MAVIQMWNAHGHWKGSVAVLAAVRGQEKIQGLCSDKLGWETMCEQSQTCHAELAIVWPAASVSGPADHTLYQAAAQLCTTGNMLIGSIIECISCRVEVAVLGLYPMTFWTGAQGHQQLHEDSCFKERAYVCPALRCPNPTASFWQPSEGMHATASLWRRPQQN